MTDRQNLDEIEVEAAGLALGLLEGNERSEALRRQLSDPRFAERVRAWQQVGDDWLEGGDHIKAPAGTLDAIEAAMDRDGAGHESEPAAQYGKVATVWRGLALTATAASLVLAVGLGFVLVERTGVGTGSGTETVNSTIMRQATNVAQIDDAAGLPLMSAVYDPASGQLSLRLADLQEPGLGPELWVIPEDGIPRSLGMLQQDRVTISISPQLQAYLQDGAAMAITLEPADAERHDAPTGAILGTAILQEVQSI